MVTLLLSSVMTPSLLPVIGVSRRVRRVIALFAIAQLAIIAAAPLAERVDTAVAAVHVEQEGTQLHHAHGDFCATCVAVQIAAIPPRQPVSVLLADARTRPVTTMSHHWQLVRHSAVLPRAPPV